MMSSAMLRSLTLTALRRGFRPATLEGCSALAAAVEAGCVVGRQSSRVVIAPPSVPLPGLRGFAASAAASGDVVKVDVPSMGDSISEGSIAALLKSPGETVEVDEALCQIETDKVTIDVKAPVSGTVQELFVQEEDTVVVGQHVASIVEGEVATGSGGSPSSSAASPSKPAPPPPPPPPAAAAAAAAPAPPSSSPSPPPSSSPSSSREERAVPMTRMRKRVAERLKGAQNTYAMLTTFNEVDMTNLTAMRSQYKDAFLEKHGVKLGFMSAFVKASSYALQEIPAVNGCIDGENIVYRDYCDISIAVATPKGLVVPVVRDVQSMNFADIEKEIGNLGKKARDGTISIDDMAGGTFTISNGGVYGSLLSTPIINPPQSAILGMHSIVPRPIALDGAVAIRPMMYIALTYDHRLVDGREAVTFLKHIKAIVEDPQRLLLDV